MWTVLIHVSGITILQLDKICGQSKSQKPRLPQCPVNLPFIRPARTSKRLFSCPVCHLQGSPIGLLHQIHFVVILSKFAGTISPPCPLKALNRLTSKLCLLQPWIGLTSDMADFTTFVNSHLGRHGGLQGPTLVIGSTSLLKIEASFQPGIS